MVANELTTVPFTDEELREIQLTLSGKIFRLQQEQRDGKITHEQADRKLRTLSKVAEKCASAQYAHQS